MAEQTALLPSLEYASESVSNLGPLVEEPCMCVVVTLPHCEINKEIIIIKKNQKVFHCVRLSHKLCLRKVSVL